MQKKRLHGDTATQYTIYFRSKSGFLLLKGTIYKHIQIRELGWNRLCFLNFLSNTENVRLIKMDKLKVLPDIVYQFGVTSLYLSLQKGKRFLFSKIGGRCHIFCVVFFVQERF